MASEIGKYEQRVTSGKPTKRVREVGEIGLVALPLARTSVQSMPAAKATTPTRLVRPATVAVASAPIAKTIPKVVAAPPPPKSSGARAPVYAANTSAAPPASGDNASSGEDDQPSYSVTPYSFEDSAAEPTEDDAIAPIVEQPTSDATLAQLAAQGAVADPSLYLSGAEDLAGLGEIVSTPKSGPTPSLVPLAIFTAAGVSAIGYGTWRKRRRR